MLFPFRPEKPLVERLRFLTDVLEHKDGSEQRVALRVAPRVEFDMDILVEDGLPRQIIENILLGDQAGTFQIPIWPDVSFLTAPASAAATSLAFNTTNARVGTKLLLMGNDDASWEIVNGVDTITDDSVGCDALTNAWPAGTEVYPLADAVIPIQVRIQRWTRNVAKYSITFAILGNDVPLGTTDLAWDAVGFGTDATCLVVDDANAMDGQLQEGSDRRVTTIDNATGAFSVFSQMALSRRSSVKTWSTVTRDRLMAVRRLLQYLQGRQKAFLLPTWGKDATPAGAVTNASTSLAVANAGFFTYNGLAVTPRRYIRVEKNDGTYDVAEVTDVTETSPSVETLTVSPAWSRTVAQADIVRITIYEKVRVNDDDIEIEHTDLLGSATISVPVKVVL